MIKANLVPKPALVDRRRLYLAINLFLAFILVGQFALLGSRLYQKMSRDKSVVSLQTELQALEAKRGPLFARGADVVAVEGALRGRNEWILGRAASPFLLLAKFEASKPGGGSFLSYQGTTTGGTIRVLMPDLETTQEWVKTALGRLSGTMNVEGQSQEGVKVFYSWSE